MSVKQTNSSDIARADDVRRDAAVRALEHRGVLRAADCLGGCDPTVALSWCQWWDHQSNVTPALLVDRIKSGQAPPSRKSMAEQQQQYGEEIVRWLRKHFPRFDRPAWGPHPAAIGAVIRLHHRHGRGQITKQEHGAEIREAVAKWDREFGQDSQSGERHEQHDNGA